MRPAMSSYLRIADMPGTERPRERLLQQGADALKSEELLAILLRTGTRGVSALDIGKQVLGKYRSLDALAAAPLEDLFQFKGLGRNKAATLKAAFTLAQRMAREAREAMPLLDSPDRIADFVREEIRGKQVEHLLLVMLNTRRRLIGIEHISQGTLDTILVHPREVFRRAITANASSIVLAHNHPSGDPTPSEGDIATTRDLIRAGQVLKIEVADHLIFGERNHARPKDYVSLRELGFFYH